MSVHRTTDLGTSTTTRGFRRRTPISARSFSAAVIAATIGVGSVFAAATSASGNGGRERVAVSEQGGTGRIDDRGARLTRHAHSLEIDFRIPTPEPGSYSYPNADMIPPFEPPHPEVSAGSPEVFTLWAFTFNHPESCSVPCNSDDLGATPAEGGAYQVDATVAVGDRIEMSGDVWRTAAPLVGAPLTEPFTAEVHLALAPHGAALEGADLTRQLNGPIGSPPYWWIAIFDDA